MRHDMTMMYAMHDALRRDLGAIATAAARRTPLLRTAAGWELFKKALLTHHLAEDEVLWPAMRVALADKDDLSLLDAMEAEHARIDPLLAAIDAALLDESRLDRLGDLADALAVELTAHLAHEEKEAIDLIDATVSEQDMAAFGAAHSKRYGSDVSRVLPWLLDGAADETAELIVGGLPEPVRNAYRDAWLPAHRAARLWP